MPDQRPVEPYSPELYSRTFVDGSAGTTMVTSNDVMRQNAMMKVHYTSQKDFRVLDGDQGDVAWSWIEESANSPSGQQGVMQMFTVDLWAPDGDGSVRIGAPWSETLLAVDASSDLQLQLMTDGVEKTQATADEYLADE